jgi:hypothetical protein
MNEQEPTWEEMISAAQAEGGKTIAPNGGPIRCIRHDGVVTGGSYRKVGEWKLNAESLERAKESKWKTR